MNTETEDQKVELVCSDVAHVFEESQELCKCGEVARHRVIRCPTCKQEYWSKRATNPTEQKEV
jgi:hypothetical protein